MYPIPTALVAFGDTYGRVRVFRYPCLPGKHRKIKTGSKGEGALCRAAFAQGLGHGPKIGAVRFSAADKYLISVGEEDGCAFQWELVYPAGEDIAAIEETDDK